MKTPFSKYHPTLGEWNTIGKQNRIIPMFKGIHKRTDTTIEYALGPTPQYNWSPRTCITRQVRMDVSLLFIIIWACKSFQRAFVIHCHWSRSLFETHNPSSFNLLNDRFLLPNSAPLRQKAKFFCVVALWEGISAKLGGNLSGHC